MLINKKNLAVAALASSDIACPALNCIRVTKEYTEAADVHVFARVSNPKVENDDFPTIPGFERNEFDDCLIPAGQASKLSKMIPKGGVCRTLPILEHVQLAKNDDGVKAVVTDLDSPTIVQIRQDDGLIYPDCDKLMPTDEPVATICVDARKLISVLQIAGTFNKGGNAKVTIEFRAPNSALVVKTDDGEQTFYGLVMPCRTE